ncbi:hypothetical protein ACHAXA_008670 [Cyclostephanos tholiformis]|uniref:C3H1-type domain-containing protein n=1 Tax=Cyclostephanos tholiformis TaxID=382380 RepID=A0ABD3R1G6_9STRA
MAAGGRTVACTISRYNLTCAICSGDVRPGDRMFCFERRPIIATVVGGGGSSGGATTSSSSSSGAVAWGHESCHDPSLPPPPPCRHWERLGRCPAMESGECAFRHDVDDDGVGVASSSSSSSSASSSDGERRGWGGRRKHVRNRHKNSTFRIFLMRTYGEEYLNRGLIRRRRHRRGGRGEHDEEEDDDDYDDYDDDDDDDRIGGVILDVAGGKGELSFELMNLSGAYECVVIDPRPLNLGMVVGKWTRGLYEPGRVGPIFSRWYPACEDGCRYRVPRNPGHIRCLFDGRAFANFARAIERIDVDRADGSYRRDIDRARGIAWTIRGLRHEDGSFHDDYDGDGGGAGVMSTTAETNDVITHPFEIIDPAVARDILRRCHLVVGLHPDQATGEIVEFAMAMHIPYCIVPCCVYSDTFVKRKLRDGTRVTTFEHLVTWLCEKDPRARTATLDLDGKNTVVYTLPDF